MEIINQLKNIIEPLMDWYKSNKRDLPWRHNPTPYRVWISEIMLQQTRVDPVIPYYLRFLEELPDVNSLADVSQDRLMKLWEGLGYYSRARNLQKAAMKIKEQGGFPEDFDGWLALPGIGEYTAGAICSIALGLPTPAVDGNVLRVLSRVLGSKKDIAHPSTKKDFTKALSAIYPKDDPSSFTQGLMELGALICLPNGQPKCNCCPLKDQCVAYLNDLTEEIPLKTPKKGRKIEERTVFILRCGDKIALQKRPSKGLLAGLWEFPNILEKMNEMQVKEAFNATSVVALASSTHIFTHIEWQMIGYEVLLEREAEGYCWFPISQILEDKAIPSAFQAYTNHLIKENRK